MLPLFKAFCFFCILLLGSVLIRGNNNLISPAVRQERSEERREGKSVSVRVDLGGRRIIKKKKKTIVI